MRVAFPFLFTTARYRNVKLRFLDIENSALFSFREQYIKLKC